MGKPVKKQLGMTKKKCVAAIQSIREELDCYERNLDAVFAHKTPRLVFKLGLSSLEKQALVLSYVVLVRDKSDA